MSQMTLSTDKDVRAKIAFALLLFLLLPILAIRASAQEPEPPQLRVTKLQKAPVIDGVIDKEEWRGATAITGFTNFGFPPLSIPDDLQPRWYLAYDDTNFYLAFQYPVYPKGSLRGKCKTREQAENQLTNEGILWDDHTEIQICTVARTAAISDHFYKFMTNAWDVMADQKIRYSIGQWGVEYETSALVRSKFNDDCWTQEIAIPLKDVGEKGLADGRKWVMQLVSAQDCAQNYYAWVPIGWLAFHAFPEVTFDSQAVAVQFTSLGEWMKGNPNLQFQLYNSTREPHDIKIDCTMLDPAGKELYRGAKQVTVKGGEETTANLAAKDIPLSQRVDRKDNTLKLHVYDPVANKTYYQVTLPVVRADSVESRQYVANLQVARKPAEAQLTYAYLPYYNKLTASADVGILGIDKAFAKEARYYRVSFGKPDGAPVGVNTMEFSKDGTAEMQFGCQTLGEGTYKITQEILDAQGKALLTKQDSFQRKIFPFEHNTLGKSDKVLPPYTPIRAEGNNLQFRGSDYTLAPTGLLAQVTSRLIPENQQMLAGEMRLLLTQDGVTTPLRGQGVQWNSKADNRATCTATAAAGPLQVKVSGQAEYEGLYVVDMELVPQGKVKIDRLQLEVPLKNPIDVININSPEGGQWLFNKTNPAQSAKNGTLWSQNGRIAQPYAIYLGNGERGLHWVVDSYENWHIDYNQPYLEIVKAADRTTLRLSLFNTSYTIDKPRTIRCMFVAVPLKPLPAHHREMAWDVQRMHAGGGSWWGTIGCFVFPQTDEEWRYLMEGKSYNYKGHQAHSGVMPIPAPPAKDGKYPMEAGKEYGVYRAADLIGYLNPEFQVFAGEWVGMTNPPVMPDPSLLNYKNSDGSPFWPEPEQRSVYLKDPLTQSFYDFELYQFYHMAKNTGLGGCWWDWNAFRKGNSLLKGSAYRADDGSIESRTNFFMARDFYQRIANIDDELGVPNTNNVYAPGMIYQSPWINRINAWETLYIENKSDDMFDAHAVDQYRSIIGKFTGLPVQIVMNVPAVTKGRQGRSIIAHALLHDNGIFCAPPDLRAMLHNFGYFDDATQWIPYWRSDKVVRATEKELLITAYQREEGGQTKYMLVVVNPTQTDLTTDLQLVAARKGITAKDMESVQPLRISGDGIKALTVPTHDYRLIEVSCEE
ncbi:MAG TPA: glycoside hydrolase domain-containing protein [Armatimonadota bacterium]